MRTLPGAGQDSQLGKDVGRALDTKENGRRLKAWLKTAEEINSHQSD